MTTTKPKPTAKGQTTGKNTWLATLLRKQDVHRRRSRLPTEALKINGQLAAMSPIPVSEIEKVRSPLLMDRYT
jgi:hypothetical protein